MTTSTSRLVIEISAEHAKRNAEALNRELVSIEKNGTFATKSMDTMSSATRTLAAQMTALVSVGALIAKMDAYTGLQNRLKLVTTSQTELNKAMSDTFSIAQKTRQSWDAAAQVYQGFANNAKQLNLTMEQTAKLTETVSKAVAISGGSAASAEAALIQFNQGLAAGALRGEELNSVMEQTPGLARAIAEGMGITIGQLRTVAAEGKITSEALVKALDKASKSVDDLFAKTDPTIGQSFTMLNNEVSKFVGEAGKASGAATLTAETIKVLAENLDLVANTAAVVGIGMLTKALATKTLALKSSVLASVQNRAAIVAEQQANVQALGIEAMRTRQLTALAATEVNLARAQYNNARSATARAAAVQRLTAAEIAHSLAIKEATVATNAYTAAQTRLNAAASLGSRALGLVGGPIGAITLGVTGLAAGYMYFQDKAAKANAELNRQSEYAKQTTEELQKLSKVQKSVALDELKEKFEDQNDELQRQARLFASAIGDVVQYNNQMGNGAKASSELYQIQAQVRAGTLSLSDALERINSIAMITPEQRAQMSKQIDHYNTLYGTVNSNAAAQKSLGIEVKISGNAAQNAAVQSDLHAKSLEGVATQAAKVNAELEKYNKQLQGNAFESLYKSGLLSQGYNSQQADAIYKLQEVRGTSAILSKEEIDNTLRTLKLQTDLTQQEKDKTEQLEKQVQLQLANNKQLENGYRVYQAFLKAGLTSNQSLAIAAQVGREGDFRNANLFGSHTDNNNGATNVGMLSWQGPRAKELLKDLRSRDLLNIDGTIKQTQEAIDTMAKFSVQEILTKKEYIKTRKAIMSGVEDYSQLSEIFGKNYVRWDFDGKKINSSKHKQKEASYYQQLSGLVGATQDTGGIKLEEFGADLDKLNQLKLQYDAKYFTESKSRQSEHEKEISDLKLLYSGKELEARISQSEKQYQAEVSLSKLQFDSQVQGWQWAADIRIQKQAEINKAVIDADIRVSDQQKSIAKQAIDEQAKYELESFRRTQKQRVDALNQVNTTELAQARQKVMYHSLDPSQRQSFTLSNEQNAANDANTQNLLNKNRGYEDDLKNKLITQQTYDKLIEDAVRVHEENKAAIQAEYADRYREVQVRQNEQQYSMYASMLTAAQGTWGTMTGIIRNAQGEQSSAYKAMFLVQQSMAAAQAIIYANLASAAAVAPPPIGLGPVAGIPLSTLLKTTGYVNAGLIMAQGVAGIAGMAHNGIDNIPKEGTWLLDKGERVLNPRQNQDLTSFLNGKQKAPDLKINIQTLPNTTADVTMNEDGSLDIRMRHIAREEAEKVVVEGLNNHNSKIGKAAKANYSIPPRR